MKKVKVLVLGNSPQINHIQFDKLDPSVITIGVNRIWLKYYPNYLYFNDGHIIKELSKYPEKVLKLSQQTKIITSDWIYRSNVQIPSWITVNSRDSVTKSRFPDSVRNAISVIHRNYLKEVDPTFYIAGVSLKWSQPSHFWKDLNYESLNNCGKDWYAPRFDLMSRNIQHLIKSNYKLISVTPDSNLNKIMRYENIENLYIKERP